MANNVTVSIYLGSKAQGEILYAKIVEAAAKANMSVSEFIKNAVEEKLNALR